jgi:hypothetical protein
MAWLQYALGYGKTAILDLDDPTSSPRISGYPVNKIVANQPVGLGSGAVYSLYYTTTTAGKIRRFIVSGSNICRIDVLYGTNGAQTILWRIYTTLESLTYTHDFKDYLPLSSTQIFQINLWNVTGSSQDYGITIEAFE